MAKFVYLYFGGSAPSSPEDGKKVMDAWMSYFGRMGEKITDGGAPLGQRKSVSGNAVSGATGYSIITAASLDEAVSFTKGHPHLMSGGSIEVIEAMPIPGT
jgi:hypothetical protein